MLKRPVVLVLGDRKQNMSSFDNLNHFKNYPEEFNIKNESTIISESDQETIMKIIPVIIKYPGLLSGSCFHPYSR